MPSLAGYSATQAGNSTPPGPLLADLGSNPPSHIGISKSTMQMSLLIN
jgi:hypothetical protein